MSNDLIDEILDLMRSKVEGLQTDYPIGSEGQRGFSDAVSAMRDALNDIERRYPDREQDEWGLLLLIRGILKNHDEAKAGNSDKGYAILAALRPWLRTAQGKHRYVNLRTPEDYDQRNIDRFLATACTHGNTCEEVAQNHFMMIDHTCDTPEYCHTYKQQIVPKPKIERPE